MPTQAGIVNEALAMIDSQATITALNDGSVEANAATQIYTPTLQMLLRQLDPDFARTTNALVAAAASSPLPPFQYEYAYPADCLRARQVAPPPTGTGSLADPFDPRPIPSEIAYDPNGGGVSTPEKVILTNQQNAWLSYTTSNVTEAMFDAAFVEAFARRIASPLAMAIAGRPDFARELLEEAERYAALAELVDERADGSA
ncbi:MAG TPA: hypothetical protein VKS24_25035 [Bradyrhizobium sp.]|nr:hypothetical protein [Bradyrhizobium sp.]